MPEIDERFMALALKEARKGLGLTSPNPAVGAVLVKGAKVIAKGFHRAAGLAHAEVEAIKSAGRSARGSTLYVTLEPCNSTGRTPPCTHAIIKAGIRKVVIGLRDPNPLVSGRGVRALKRAGIEVCIGVLDAKCRELIEPYLKYITTGLPFVLLKLAATLDGRSATGTGESKWITGPASRRRVHQMRSLVDAVMVGSSTVVADDPRLNVRGVKGGGDPARVVLDTRFKSPLDAKIFKTLRRAKSAGAGRIPPAALGFKGRAFVYTTAKAPNAKVKKAKAAGIEVRITTATKDGVSLTRVLRDLASMGITSVMVEAGPRLAAAFLGQGLVDRVAIFTAPTLLGSDATASVGALHIKRLKGALNLRDVTITRLDKDLLVEGYL